MKQTTVQPPIRNGSGFESANPVGCLHGPLPSGRMPAHLHHTKDAIMDNAAKIAKIEQNMSPAPARSARTAVMV